MTAPLSIADVQLVCAILEKAKGMGRGASSAVAVELDIARQSVSDTLKGVEARFGCTLIAGGNSRTGGLTSAGYIFLEGGRALLTAYDELCDQLDPQFER